jgi:hypothetical protein
MLVDIGTTADQFDTASEVASEAAQRTKTPTTLSR